MKQVKYAVILFRRVDLSEVLDLHSFDSKNKAKWVAFVLFESHIHKLYLFHNIKCVFLTNTL